MKEASLKILPAKWFHLCNRERQNDRDRKQTSSCQGWWGGGGGRSWYKGEGVNLRGMEMSYVLPFSYTTACIYQNSKKSTLKNGEFAVLVLFHNKYKMGGGGSRSMPVSAQRLRGCGMEPDRAGRRELTWASSEPQLLELLVCTRHVTHSLVWFVPDFVQSYVPRPWAWLPSPSLADSKPRFSSQCSAASPTVWQVFSVGNAPTSQELEVSALEPCSQVRQLSRDTMSPRARARWTWVACSCSSSCQHFSLKSWRLGRENTSILFHTYEHEECRSCQ